MTKSQEQREGGGKEGAINYEYKQGSCAKNY